MIAEAILSYMQWMENRQKDEKMCINNNGQQESVLLMVRQRQTKNYIGQLLAY